MLLIAMDGLEETKELMKDIQSKVKSSWSQAVYYKYPSEKWFKECKQSFAELRESRTCTQEGFFTIVHDQMKPVNVRTMSLEAAFFALDIDDPPFAPVVMFCGHANMNGYPEFTLDRLAALAISCDAIVVGFLGCCVGRVREGDLLRITHTNGWTAIAGASDRMVTKDDIINTLFLNGAAYLCKMLGQTVPSTDNILADKRCLARFALCMAYTCNEQSPPNDPFIFFNDSDAECTMNSWLQLAHQGQGCPTGTRDDLLRIAMYHTWTYGGRIDLVDSVQNKLKQHTCLDEKEFDHTCLDEKEFDEMKDYLMLDTLERSHQKLQKIKVTDDTLKTLAAGQWVKVAMENPVQLAVALYRGVRGSLENGDVISLMIYCFAYIKTSEDFDMIATALVATCETAYFVSDGKNNSVHVETCNVRLNQKIELKVDILYSVPISNASPFKEIKSLDDNKKVYLTCSQTWELKYFVVKNHDSFELEKFFVFQDSHGKSVIRDDFVRLMEQRDGSIELGSMHSIITKLGINVQQPRTYQYTYVEFMAALEQLSHHMKKESPRSEGWGVKEFSIIPPEGSDRVQVLPSRSTKGSVLYGREVRLMNSSNDNKCLERCRFVYLYTEKQNNGYYGNLYYTDVHYWWDLSILLVYDSINAQIRLEELVTKASEIYDSHNKKHNLAKLILGHKHFLYPLDFIGILSFPVDCSNVENIHLETL